MTETKEELEERIERHTKEIAEDPKKASKYCERAYCYNELKMYDLAIFDCTTALEIDEKSIHALNNRGYSYNYSKKYELALKDLNSMLILCPEDEDGYTNRAFTYEKLGRYKDAVNDLKVVYNIKKKENEGNVFPELNGIGLMYLKMKKYHKSYKYFNKAVKLQNVGKNSHSLNNRGYILNCFRSFDDAICDFTKSVEITPHEAHSHAHMGYSYACKKDYKKAFQLFEKAISINPKYPRTYYYKGVVLFELNNYDDAEENLRKAVEIDPLYSEVRVMLDVVSDTKERIVFSSQCFGVHGVNFVIRRKSLFVGRIFLEKINK